MLIPVVYPSFSKSPVNPKLLDILNLYFFAYDCEREVFHKLSYREILAELPTSEIARYPDNNKLYYKINL